MLFISINLLSVVYYLPVKCRHIFCAFVVTQWFCSVCIKHHSCTCLGISLFQFKIFIQRLTLNMFCILFNVIVGSFIHQYSALEAGLAGTRAQSYERYGCCTLHPGQELGGSLPLLSLAFTLSHFRRQVPGRLQ